MWAGQLGKRVTSTTILDRHPETFRLEAGNPMVTPNEYAAVVLPLSGNAVDVEIKAEGSEASRASWAPETAMFLEAGKAFSPIEGSTHVVYVLVRVEAST